MAANTLLSCPSGASGCAQAREGAPGAVLNDNGWDMQFVDVDSDPGTFNSSSADVFLPADASILFAGPYWGANATRGVDGQPAPDPGSRNTVLLATPTSGAYATSAPTPSTRARRPR
jgi:large repetitive protein